VSLANTGFSQGSSTFGHFCAALVALTPTTSKAQDTLVPGRAEVAAVIDAALDIEHCTLLELLPAVTYTRQSGSSSGQLEMTKNPGAATPFRTLSRSRRVCSRRSGREAAPTGFAGRHARGVFVDWFRSTRGRRRRLAVVDAHVTWAIMGPVSICAVRREGGGRAPQDGPCDWSGG
jgi:hypothetical protein